MEVVAVPRERDVNLGTKAGAAPDPAASLGRDDDLAALFFEASKDLLAIRDSEGRIVRASPSWHTILGYTPEELVGVEMISLIHPDDVITSRATIQGIAKMGGEVSGFINRYRCADGSYRHIEWRARLRGDKVYGIGRDVTERIAHEAAMEAARASVEAANRAMSEFLATMSHEIRTPLNGVMGLASALARTELTPPQAEMLALIERSGATMERLVSDVLYMAKIESGRLDIETAPFDLAEEIDALAETTRVRAAEKGLAFELAVNGSLDGRFEGDATRIRQVLANILGNAIKFTDKGHVRLSVDVAEPDSAGQPALVTFAIEDTGIGFDAEQARRLFQRFSQADSSITRRFGGTGLGLAISQSLTQLMGGTIEAESEPGKGSRFTIRLPLGHVAARANQAVSAGHDTSDEALAAIHWAGLRVLLAEDHPVNQKVVQLLLGPLGVSVTTVDDGAAAVDAFARGRFDLVLMDMQMPVMDGLTATRTIRTFEAEAGKASRTPVVMLSANAMDRHRTEAAAAGVDTYVAKPVTARGLMEGMANALAHRPVAA